VHERGLDQDWADAKVREFENTFDFLKYAAEARESGEVPTGTRRYITTIHTVAAAEGQAVAFGEEFFAGPDDRALTYDPEARTYDVTRGEVEYRHRAGGREGREAVAHRRVIARAILQETLNDRMHVRRAHHPRVDGARHSAGDLAYGGG